jgi:hypothetical protein
MGPVGVSRLVYGESDDALQADAEAFLKAFSGNKWRAELFVRAVGAQSTFFESQYHLQTGISR